MRKKSPRVSRGSDRRLLTTDRRTNQGIGGMGIKASPHKRRLKCDTNISPRRLIIHLLHQMVHHCTTLRGNGQWSATITRITTKTHTTTLTTKRSSEFCAIRSFLRVTLFTGTVGCRTEPLLNVFGNEVWIFLCRNLKKMG